MEWCVYVDDWMAWSQKKKNDNLANNLPCDTSHDQLDKSIFGKGLLTYLTLIKSQVGLFLGLIEEVHLF